VLRDLDVAISEKIIPNDFFVISACHTEHDDIILGRPCLKLVNAVLDAGKGRVTIDLDGTKSTYDFLPASRIALPLSLNNEKVVDLCFLDTFKDPLQRAMENNAMYDDQDKELAEAIVVRTSLGPLPRWVLRPTTWWAPRTTRLVLHGI
jgi:hypothetical protein